MRVHKIREANRIMGCFEDYMQFRDEVEAAKKRLNVMEKERDAGADGQASAVRAGAQGNCDIPS